MIKSQHKQAILINVILGQAFLVLFLMICGFYNSAKLSHIYISQFITAVFVLTTFFLLGQINYLARKEAEALVYHARMQESRQLVQIFESHHQDFLGCLDNLGILNNLGDNEMVGSYITQLRNEYRNLLEIIKLDVPGYIAIIIKKAAWAELDFTQVRFVIRTDLKKLGMAPADFAKIIEFLYLMWSCHNIDVPLEDRFIILSIVRRGNSFVFRFIFHSLLDTADFEIKKEIADIELLLGKYQGTLSITGTCRGWTMMETVIPHF